MKKTGHYGLTILFVICCLVFMGYPVLADDTCVFSVTGDILSRTTTFMAPVVPAARTTTSGDKIYMAFFKPSESNFWEGNVTKYGISSDNQIIDATPPPDGPVLATWPNGAMKNDAVPYWATMPKNSRKASCTTPCSITEGMPIAASRRVASQSMVARLTGLILNLPRHQNVANTMVTRVAAELPPSATPATPIVGNGPTP